MRSKRRLLALSLAALVTLGFGVLLLALRYGRPLYYSDGQRSLIGASMAQGSMMEFGEVHVKAEFPREVVGRVALLPDGRWIYGLRSTEGQVDLVTQDPARPGLPPIALGELNSDGLDFAPAIGPGPVLYFASDRAGGEGGLDLYRSEWRDGSFGPVQALRGGINTEADESDPAPAMPGPLVGSIVFVRQPLGARHSQLCLADLVGEQEPTIVYPEWEQPARQVLIRDPIFGPGGRSLYFVRGSRKGASLLRTAVHQGQFLEPWPLAGLERDSWRSPLPGSRGLSIELLRPGDPALLYRSEAQERLVYWEGQHDLEQMLLMGLFISLLFVILITLGGRWSSLDLLTKLLLLSLLIHGLILLWMSRVDILTRQPEERGDWGTIEVEILSQEGREEAVGAEAGRTMFHPVEELGFELAKAALRAEGPETQVTEAQPRPGETRVVAMPEISSSERTLDEETAILSDAVEVTRPERLQESVAGLEQTTERGAKQAQVESLAGETQRTRHEVDRLVVQVPITRSLSSAVGGPVSRRRVEMPGLQRLDPAQDADTVSMSDDVGRRKIGLAEESLTGLKTASEGGVSQGPAENGVDRLRADDKETGPLSVQLPQTLPPALERKWPRPGMAVGPPRTSMPDPDVSKLDLVKLDDELGRKAHATSASDHGRQAPGPERTSALESAVRPALMQERSVGMHLRSRSSLSTSISALPVPGSALARAPRPRHGERNRREDPRPGVFRNRFGTARLEALRRYGGTEKTEAAVRRGLAYLARAQKDDGSWGNKAKVDRKYGETFVGKTALCLLAFLGAGHVPGKRNVHSEVSRKAMEFLLFVQDEETGHFGLGSAYSHGISTYALAECYALSKDESLRVPLLSAVAWILANQNQSRDRRHDGGWGYYSPTLLSEDGFARTSISSWQVMALLSAKKAGFVVPKSALQRARRFFSNSYDRRRGYFLYSREPARLRSRWRTLPASTPASVFSLLLLGEEPDSARVQGGLGFTLARRPRSYRWQGDDAFVRKAVGNTYFWYYGSLACFLAGGETWKQWNQSLVAVLPQAQQEDGSFPPLGPYASYAGDDRGDHSYTTAMCVLSLEVYYRYFTPLLQGR